MLSLRTILRIGTLTLVSLIKTCHTAAIHHSSTRFNRNSTVARFAYTECGVNAPPGNNGFQGADLDWEFPGIASRGGRPGDAAHFVSLVQEMRAAFSSKYGISIALPPDSAYLRYFDPSALTSSVDFFNFMAYDLHGPWEAATLGANVRSQSSILDASTDLLPLWFDSVPPAKVNLGIPYYGRGFTLQDPSCSSLGCSYLGASTPGPCTGSAGVLSLGEIKSIIQQKNLVPKLLGDEMIKQISWGDQWIGYDDADTINLKSNWADEHCMGGLVFWSVDLAGTGSQVFFLFLDIRQSY